MCVTIHIGELCLICYRRPSGLDTEFILQLFVEKSETTLFTMREMLFKCMRDQNITFAQVFILYCIHTLYYVSAFIVFI